MIIEEQKKGNIIKRIDRIMGLLFEICLENPIRIDKTKVIKTIDLINLAWVIAICRKNYNFFSEIVFEDKNLNSMYEMIRVELISAIDTPTKLKLKPRYTPEVELVFGVCVTDTLSYELPPELVIKIIANEAIYKIKCIHSGKRKSSRKDVLSEALSREIFPALEKEGHKRNTSTDYAKLCWEKLSDALKAIGCTHVEVAELGSECDQDSLEFHAKHGALTIPSKNFKAFRQRIARMAKN